MPAAFAEQQLRDRILRPIFRKPERIARHHTVIDYQPRQQKATGIAASCVDALASQASCTALAT